MNIYFVFASTVEPRAIHGRSSVRGCRASSLMRPVPIEEPHSDNGSLAAPTDPRIVMAEQITHDVVKEALSMGGPAPVDDTATTTNHSAGTGEVPSSLTTTNSKASYEISPTAANVASTDAIEGDDRHASEVESGDTANVSRTEDKAELQV